MKVLVAAFPEWTADAAGVDRVAAAGFTPTTDFQAG